NLAVDVEEDEEPSDEDRPGESDGEDEPLVHDHGHTSVGLSDLRTVVSDAEIQPDTNPGQRRRQKKPSPLTLHSTALQFTKDDPEVYPYDDEAIEDVKLDVARFFDSNTG